MAGGGSVDIREGTLKLSSCSWFILSLSKRSVFALFCYFASEQPESEEIRLGVLCFFLLLFCSLSLSFLFFLL